MNLDWILLGLRLFTTVVLYAFLGLALYIIWRDLKQTGQSAVAHHLRVLSVPQNSPLAEGDKLPLQPVTYLGRDPACTIVLQDDAASGRHARLHQESGIWWLEDLGSRNGTMLNDLPLVRQISLTDGDIIGIGTIRFRFETTQSN
jgi:hypothetical protein